MDIKDGFKLLGLDENINKSYDDISEYAYNLLHPNNEKVETVLLDKTIINFS